MSEQRDWPLVGITKAEHLEFAGCKFTINNALPDNVCIVATGKEVKAFRLPVPESERSAALESALQAWRME